MKKAIALICVLALCLCCVPAPAQAAEVKTENSSQIPSKAAAPTVNLRFAGATLTLENDLTVTFYVKPTVMAYYSDVRVEFTMNGETTVVETPTGVNASGQSGFAYAGVSPRKMKDTITVTIYGTYDGVEYSFSMNYTAAKYCYNTLRATSDPLLKTLLVDLLNFGTAHQNYMDYNRDNLVNGELTDEEAAFGSDYEQSFESCFGQTGTSDTASWRGATLVLNSAINIRYTLRCENINGASVRVTVDGEDYWIDSSEWKLVEGYSDRYYVYFEALKARQMESEVYATIYRGDYATSKTCCYSVETYAAGAVANDILVELISKMMYYGRSAYNYVNG